MLRVSCEFFLAITLSIRGCFSFAWIPRNWLAKPEEEKLSHQDNGQKINGLRPTFTSNQSSPFIHIPLFSLAEQGMKFQNILQTCVKAHTSRYPIPGNLYKTAQNGAHVSNNGEYGIFFSRIYQAYF
jgi:hypothetical protein